MTERSVLDGLKILVVEDQTLIAMYIEDTLEALGCRVVGRATRLAIAVEMACTLDLDVAVLDVSLGRGDDSFPVAKALETRGIPFLFMTGYGEAGVESRYRRWPVLIKPIDVLRLARELRALAAPLKRP